MSSKVKRRVISGSSRTWTDAGQTSTVLEFGLGALGFADLQVGAHIDKDFRATLLAAKSQLKLEGKLSSAEQQMRHELNRNEYTLKFETSIGLPDKSYKDLKGMLNITFAKLEAKMPIILAQSPVATVTLKTPTFKQGDIVRLGLKFDQDRLRFLVKAFNAKGVDIWRVDGTDQMKMTFKQVGAVDFTSETPEQDVTFTADLDSHPSQRYVVMLREHVLPFARFSLGDAHPSAPIGQCPANVRFDVQVTGAGQDMFIPGGINETSTLFESFGHREYGVLENYAATWSNGSAQLLTDAIDHADAVKWNSAALDLSDTGVATGYSLVARKVDGKPDQEEQRSSPVVWLGGAPTIPNENFKLGGVSDDGVVLGQLGKQAALYDGTVFPDLGFGGVALDRNASGVTVGSVTRKVQEGNTQVEQYLPVKWQDGKMTVLWDDTYAGATRVNARGDVLGLVNNDRSVWLPAGAAQPTEVTSLGFRVDLRDLNDAGELVGSIPGLRGVLRLGDGQVVDLNERLAQTLPGSGFHITDAVGINNKCEIAAIATNSESDRVNNVGVMGVLLRPVR
ncbi:hypothetical protein [Deinococcus pimensis]|uniref:hypothetical protein n=1 Tax=Deinococcus pimensis TaxID=309888 RepID=UPI00047F3577|nr:hypothetical protein [Deinococcus pimensis]